MCLADRLLVAAVATVALAGCGDLPQPFLGRPGATAMRLSQPPPSRLAVPPPRDALLTDAAARTWSGAVAKALVAMQLPANAAPASRGDWRLVLTASLKDGAVIPAYTILDPQGAPQGTSQGPPVPPGDWAAGGAGTLNAAADEEAPKVVDLLTGIEARRQMSDPHSLLNRPPVLYFKGVTGAPGDGDTSLAKQMTTRLPTLGDVVQDTGQGADFSVEGQVKTAPGARKTTRIEIQWIVVDAKGQERGRVVQLNEVPPGSLDSYWGEVAIAVAAEAAGGVHEVVVQASGRAGPAAPASSKPEPAPEG